jgi:hypothetical protein
MLPGTPPDGGRVLRAALWRRFRDRGRAGLAAARAGSVLRTVIAFTGVRGLLAHGSLDGLWLVIIGVFIANAADSEAHTVSAVNALAGLLVSDVMTPDPGIAPAAFSVAAFTAIEAHCRQDVFLVTPIRACHPGGATGTASTTRAAPSGRHHYHQRKPWHSLTISFLRPAGTARDHGHRRAATRPRSGQAARAGPVIGDQSPYYLTGSRHWLVSRR